MISEKQIAVGPSRSHGDPWLINCVGCLPDRPLVAAPITAAFMLTEAEFLARAPAPIVLVDNDTGVGRIAVGLVGVPADVAGTDDGGRCAGRSQREQGGAGEGGLGQNVHGHSSIDHCPLANYQAWTAFRRFREKSVILIS